MRKRIYKAKKLFTGSRVENKSTPTQSDYQKLWMDSIPEEELGIYTNVVQSKAFFNVSDLATDSTDWAEECFKRDFLSEYSYPALSDFLKRTNIDY